ncbi:MAG: hypothetical protein CM15mP77_1170 [Synechococcus sp.]|nr:MAG: hypothetical protein CM15mP77_1170 [Synechococcus sp.]
MKRSAWIHAKLLIPWYGGHARFPGFEGVGGGQAPQLHWVGVPKGLLTTLSTKKPTNPLSTIRRCASVAGTNPNSFRPIVGPSRGMAGYWETPDET